LEELMKLINVERKLMN